MLARIFPHTHPLRLLYHRFWGIASALRYGFPARRMKIIGVTGTDGKSTTVSLITQLLTLSGKSVGMASTVAFQVGDRYWTNTTHKTTLGRFGLQKLLKEMADAGCEYAVVEVSSHALMQSRTWGIDFDTVVWTNLSREHLDYHGTMDEYCKAKGQLFQKCVENTRAKKRVGVVFGDCAPYTAYFRSFLLDKVILYGDGSILEKTMPLEEREELMWYSNREEGVTQKFTLYSEGASYDVELSLIGECNVQNVLAAVAVVKEEGINTKDLLALFPRLRSIPGRMEPVQVGQSFGVIIDYAVTPDALKKCYTMLRGLTGGRLIAVLGACGDRDQGKRFEMGQIAVDQCDYVFLTDEEPYSEDPLHIIAMLEQGARTSVREGHGYECVVSRKDAICNALNMARAGDMVVITGMGDQTSRVIDGHGTTEAWSDREVIQEELKKLLQA